MIAEIGLYNFKCFAKEKIKLGDLTLLTGLNGMGKSSVIQSLLILRQSIKEGSLEHGRVATVGSLVDLGTARDVLYDRAGSEGVLISLRFRKNDRNWPFYIIADNKKEERIHRFESKNRRYLNILKQADLAPQLFDKRSKENFSGHISFFQYVQAERNGPRKYLPTFPDQTSFYDVGVKGEYVLDFLSTFGQSVKLDENDPRRIPDADGNRLIDQAMYWLNEVSPGVSLSVTDLPGADLVLGGYNFGEAGELRSRNFRPTNVGFGISYVLPVITALIAAPAGGLVLLENPEAHLHPRGQTKLGELCARAAQHGVQVIIESHSDHLMDGIRIAASQGVINHKKVVFHYFHRRAGQSVVTTPVLSENGRLSEWPDGFSDQHRKNAVALIAVKE